MSTRSLQLLTIPEVAERLRCGKSTVYELIATGALAVTDVSVRGRARTRISDQAVDRFIESRTRTAPRRAS